MSAPLLLHDLSVGHDRRAVACHITARLAPGRLACLVGKNGAGKSTLLHTIAGFLNPLAGQISIGSTPLSGLTPQERAKTIGIVLAQSAETANITVGELVAMGRAPYTNFFGRLTPADAEATRQALHTVGIAHLAERKMAQLSDGERQKALIAKTLAQQTPIVLLDEPTAFLDFGSRIEMLSLLARLAEKEQKAILLSTHDIPLALPIAHELWLLHTPEHHTPPTLTTIPLPLSATHRQMLLSHLGLQGEKDFFGSFSVEI